MLAYPLTFNNQQSQGSSLLMTSIPYQQRLQWASTSHNGNFYALYRKLPYGTNLPTWDSQSTPTDVTGLLACTGGRAVVTNLTTQQGSLNLTSNALTTLATLTGPAQIRNITFRVPLTEATASGNTTIRITWDNATQPAVDLPLKFLAGDGAGVYEPTNRPLVNSWLTSINKSNQANMQFSLSWPMPFSKLAKIQLLSSTAINDITWSVGTTPFNDPPAWWGNFHATYSTIQHPVAGQDMTFLDYKGSGKLVGTIINFGAPDGTLEGDPHIYLDDSQTPQISVTGTEEWGLGGDYWHGGTQVSLPMGGLPSSINNPPGSDLDGSALYRYLVADSIPFNRHLLVRWEHGATNNVDRTYRAAMLFYATPSQTAQLSDTVSTTDATSTREHLFTATNTQTSALQAAYEATTTSHLTTANVLTSTGTTSFTVNVNPNNVGTFLRRTFNYCIANQRAIVTIDGQPAGIWYDAGNSPGTGIDNHPRCWRDEDFPLPANLTVGKSSVTITLTFVPTTQPANTTWTSVDYQMYSYVPASKIPQANGMTGFTSFVL
jgi:hypothetical protein